MLVLFCVGKGCLLFPLNLFAVLSFLLCVGDTQLGLIDVILIVLGCAGSIAVHLTFPCSS